MKYLPASIMRITRRRESAITLGDRANAAGQWERAGRYYRKALDRNPINPPIWVQYGHALKESGQLAEAEAAYRRALSYEPGAADTHIQLGHALKLQGKLEEAREAYFRAAIFDGQSTQVMQELSDLGWPGEKPYMQARLPLFSGRQTTDVRIDSAAWSESVLLAASKLFDAEYYRTTNSDVDFSQTDPLTHYLSFGHKKGSSFHPLFDLRHYSKADVALSRSKVPLMDFLLTPKGERASPNPFFDREYYYSNHDDIRRHDLCPYEHFLVYGRYEPHRKVNSIFSAKYILNRFPTTHFRDTSPANYYLANPAAGRLRFVFVGHEASRTGAPLILLRIIEYFSSWSNIDSFLILDRGGPLVEEYKKHAHVMVIQDHLRGYPSEADRAEAVSYLLDRIEGNITAVICNTLETRYVGEELAFKGFPTFLLAHEMPEFYPADVLNRISKWTKKIIVPANCLRQEFLKKLAPQAANKVEVMPQGLLSWNFGRMGRAHARRIVLKELRLPDDAVIVIGCGTIDSRKGADWFSAVGRVVLTNLPVDNVVYFIWIGGPSPNDSRAIWAELEAEKWGMQDRIRFLGERPDVEQYFTAGDIFLLTSRADPFPCVIHEAMAARLAIVAFAGSGGAPEALADGAGLCVPFGNTEKMAQAVMDLAADPARRTLLGEIAQIRVTTKYQFSKYAGRLMDEVAANIALESTAYGEHRLLPAERTRRHIVFSAADWGISGANSLTEALAKRLLALGYDTTILFTRGRFCCLDRQLMPSVPYEFLQPEDESPGAIWQSVQTYLRDRAPCIYVPNYDYLASAVSSVLPPSIGIVGIAHADDVEHYEHCYRLGLYWNRIIAVSATIRSGLIEINPALGAKTTVVHSGVPITPLPEPDIEPVSPRRPLRLVYAGRFVQNQKRILDYVRLAQKLEQAGMPFHLTLAGDGPELDRIRGELSSMIAQGRVEVPGRLDAGKVRDLEEQSDVFVLLSDFEGLPIALLEAMERGCIPVAYSMRSGISEVIQDGQNGYILPARRLDVVVDTLLHIARDASLRQQLSKAARDTIVDGGWSDDMMAAGYHEVFSAVFAEIIGGNSIRLEPLAHMSPIGGILPPMSMFRAD